MQKNMQKSVIFRKIGIMFLMFKVRTDLSKYIVQIMQNHNMMFSNQSRLKFEHKTRDLTSYTSKSQEITKITIFLGFFNMK